MKKYFFVPGHKKKYIERISNLDSDFFIIDLEDSITNENINEAIQNIGEIIDKNELWLRVPLALFDTDKIELIRSFGYNKFVIPKICTIDEFEEIIYPDEKYILLIENPKILLKCEKLVEKHNLILHGISLGSHDYAAEMNMKHTRKNLFIARFYILNVAKTYGINAIDIANMEVENDTFIRNEILESFDLGFNGKYFIHPNQINVFNNIKFYSDEEVKEAKEILTLIEGNDDFRAFHFNGKVVEKPHLKRFKEIMKYIKRYD